MTNVRLVDNGVTVAVDAEHLQRQSLMIATPMYGGMCTGRYTASVIALTRACTELGVEVSFEHRYSESLIPRARNELAHRFLRSASTHLMFVDADIGFSARSVLTMLALTAKNSGYDVIGGVCPRKNLAWARLRDAALAGRGADNALDLRVYGADFVVNELPGSTERSRNTPREVAALGSGFMLIPRATLNHLVNVVPAYVPDDIMNSDYNPEPVSAFFDTVIDPVSRRYLSEDFAFCRTVRAEGMRVWMCPWVRLTHTGSHLFVGDPGVSLDADPSGD